MIIMSCPVYVELYVKLIHGVHERMGDVIRSDLGESTEVLHVSLVLIFLCIAEPLAKKKIVGITLF